MSEGRAEGSAGQRNATIALIAVVGAETGISASYRIAETASEEEKREIARKLREIAQAIGDREAD